MTKWRLSPTIQVALLLAGLLVTAIFSIMLKAPETTNGTEVLIDRSIYNIKASGLRAWYLANQKAGLSIQTWEKTFEDLKDIPTPSTMLMLQPHTMVRGSVVYGPNEKNPLLAWVAKGNTLVLLDDFNRLGSAALLKQLKLQIQHVKPQSQALIVQASNLSAHINMPLKSTISSFFMLPATSEYQVLLTDLQKHPVLIQLPYQRGKLILGSTPALFENSHLHENLDGNYQFLTNLLATEHHPIFINEFIHGYSQVQDIFSYYREKTPVGAIFMQLFFILILTLWLSAMRWTPIVVIPDNAHRLSGSLRTFIDSLANLYYRRQATSLAIQPQFDEIESLLKRKYYFNLDDNNFSLLDPLLNQYSNKDSALKALKTVQTFIENDESDNLSHSELYQLSQHLSGLQDYLQNAKR